MEFKLRFWTGPTAVEELATRAREAGYDVAAVGTEHLHVWVKDPGDGWGAVSAEENLVRDLGLTARRGLSEMLDTRGREALRDTLAWRTPRCRHRHCGDVLVLDEPHENPSHEVWRCDDCQRVHNGWGDCMEDYRS